MAKRYQVVAPYVTLTTSTVNPGGTPTLIGFYKDSVVPADVPQNQIEHHLSTGQITELPGDEQAAVTEAERRADAASKVDAERQARLAEMQDRPDVRSGAMTAEQAAAEEAEGKPSWPDRPRTPARPGKQAAQDREQAGRQAERPADKPGEPRPGDKK